MNLGGFWRPHTHLTLDFGAQAFLTYCYSCIWPGYTKSLKYKNGSYFSWDLGCKILNQKHKICMTKNRGEVLFFERKINCYYVQLVLKGGC